MWTQNKWKEWIAWGAIAAGLMTVLLFMVFPFETVAVPVAMFWFIAGPAGLMYCLFGE